MRRNLSPDLTRFGVASALVGALMLLSTAAAAQDDVTLAMARERFKEGVGYFDKKDFAKARVAFLQAYALKKHPAVLLNLAQSELRSGHEADAAKHFAQYLRDHKDATESERQGAEAGLTAAKALVAELKLTVDTKGAEVYVDGDLEGTAPLPGSVFLTPGSHKIQAQKDGRTANSQVTATAGQSVSLALELATAAADPGVAPDLSAASGNAETLPPPAGEAATTRREPFVRWLTHTRGAMVGVGLTGLGAVGGVAFALVSNGKYNAADTVASAIADEAVNRDGKADRKGACVDPEVWLKGTTVWGSKSAAQIANRAGEYTRNCNKYKDNVDSGDTFKKVAIVSAAVAGAAAVGTVIYYILDTNSAQSALRTTGPRVVVLPIYEPGFAGALVSGSF